MFYNFLNNLSPASTDEPTQKLSQKTHYKKCFFFVNYEQINFTVFWGNLYFVCEKTRKGKHGVKGTLLTGKIGLDGSRDRIAGGGGSCPVQWHDAPKQI